MPQLDILTYFTQFIWFIFIFLSFYIIVSNYIIPNIAMTLKIRNRMLKNNIVAATYNKDKINIETLILEALKTKETPSK